MLPRGRGYGRARRLRRQARALGIHTVGEETMVKDNTDPNWTARIITSFAMVLALAGGLWLFDKANRDTGTPTAIATSATCDKASGDEAIAACTRAINSGRLRSHDLAVEYYNRGY
jgi:hypothetical protein